MIKFKIEEWTIQDLIDIHNVKKVNLNPSYQRNDIWTAKAQKELIQTIKSGLPIPNLFFHDKGNNSFDITDGQQRTRAILAYVNKDISDINNIKFIETDSDFLDYVIPITIISEDVTEEEIRMFYVKVNNTGLRVNQPELTKAKYFDSDLLKMVEELTKIPDFVSLGIFSEKQSDRMLDREFIEELICQIKYGITDKKNAIQRLYETPLPKKEITTLQKAFLKVIKIFTSLNKSNDFANSRYSQKNDFYTLFGFINAHIEFEVSVFAIFFEILSKIQFDISPSNESCQPLQEYAFHCVSQSNSTNAREKRLTILEDILLNPNKTPNKTQKQLLKYYKLPITELIKIDLFTTVSPKKINRQYFGE